MGFLFEPVPMPPFWVYIVALVIIIYLFVR